MKKSKKPQDATLRNVRAANTRIDCLTLRLNSLRRLYDRLEERLAKIEKVFVGTGIFCAKYTWSGKKQAKKKAGKKGKR